MNALTDHREFAAPARRAARPHRFTVDDVRAMVRHGVIEEGAKVELIEGRLIDMPADGPLHIDWTDLLNRWLVTSIGPEYAVIPGSTLVLSKENAPKPDFYVFRRETPTAEVRGPDVRLAIEESDTSLTRDLQLKAGLYARHGVRDYWVIDLKRRRVHVHRDPGPTAYGSVSEHGADEAVEALLIPGLSLRLSELRAA